MKSYIKFCKAFNKKYILRTQFFIPKFLYINVRDNSTGKLKGDTTMARVLISMPERFLTEIDQVAGNENRTRSELIREALRTYMYRNQVRNSQKAIKNAELIDAMLG